MSVSLNRIVLLLLISRFAFAQSTTRPSYMEHAAIRHSGLTATVTAYFPTPLFQAMDGIRQEYGWSVNWEEAPCYSRFDVVDDTSPKWRAAHPDAEGVTRKAGGLFSSTFPEPKVNEPTTEEMTLRKIIDDYNATDNPGKYALRVDAGGRYTVVGIEVRNNTGELQKVTPILDTPVSLEAQKRSASEVLESILQSLSSASGKRIIAMSFPNNLFRDTQVSVGGHNVPARQLLQELFRATQRPLQYDLGFDPDRSSVYLINVSVAARMQMDNAGRSISVPIDRRR